MHLFIYSLRTNNDLPELDISLGMKLVHETHHQIQFDFGDGIFTLSKFDYLNKMKLYDNGKVFFIICTKSVSRESAFECLMKHAISKINMRIEKLTTLKTDYQKQIVAA